MNWPIGPERRRYLTISGGPFCIRCDHLVSPRSIASIRTPMSAQRHAVIPGPIFIGAGKRPLFTPAHQVDLPTGMTAGIGGSALRSPRMSQRRAYPISGSLCLFMAVVPRLSSIVSIARYLRPLESARAAATHNSADPGKSSSIPPERIELLTILNSGDVGEDRADTDDPPDRPLVGVKKSMRPGCSRYRSRAVDIPRIGQSEARHAFRRQKRTGCCRKELKLTV